MIAKRVVGLEFVETPTVAEADYRVKEGCTAIINPYAGPHHDSRWYDNLGRNLERELSAEVCITQSTTEVAALLNSACRARYLAVFGGDGTLAEVVNHMDFGEQILLPLPGGSGNGLARDLGLNSVEHSIAAWRANLQETLDLVEVKVLMSHAPIQRLVISTSSIGYCTDGVVLAKQLSRALGPLRYTIASILQAARTPARTMDVATDGTPLRPVRLTNLMVNNTKHAGNFCVFRDASLLDGRFDVLLADNGFWQQVLHNLGMLTRTYVYQPGEEFSTHSLHVRLPGPLQLMLDGEIWDDVHEVRFSVLPRQLRCYSLRGKQAS